MCYTIIYTNASEILSTVTTTMVEATTSYMFMLCSCSVLCGALAGKYEKLFLMYDQQEGQCYNESDCEPVLTKRGQYLKECAESNCESFSRRVGTKDISLTRNVSRLQPGVWEIFVEKDLQHSK